MLVVQIRINVACAGVSLSYYNAQFRPFLNQCFVFSKFIYFDEICFKPSSSLVAHLRN
jgi:hypothetical protein